MYATHYSKFRHTRMSQYVSSVCLLLSLPMAGAAYAADDLAVDSSKSRIGDDVRARALAWIELQQKIKPREISAKTSVVLSAVLIAPKKIAATSNTVTRKAELLGSLPVMKAIKVAYPLSDTQSLTPSREKIAATSNTDAREVGLLGSLPVMKAIKVAYPLSDMPPPTPPRLDLRAPLITALDASISTSSSDVQKERTSRKNRMRIKVPGQDQDLLTQMLSDTPDSIDNDVSPSAEQMRKIFSNAAEVAAARRPEIHQAQASHQAALAEVDEAKGQRLPQIGVGAQTATKYFGVNDTLQRDTGHNASVSLTLPIYTGGRITKTIASRKQLAVAGLKQYEVQQQASAYEVTTTIIELGKQRIITDLSQQYVDRMTTLVMMLSEIVAVDRGRASELTQAKARLLQAEVTRDNAQASARNAEINLRKLVGDVPVPIPRSRVWQITPGNVATLLADGLQHPIIQQASAQASAADLNAEAVRAAGKPQVNWVINKATGRDGLDRPQPWQTMVTMSWNIFEGGSRSAATEAAAWRAKSSWQVVDQQRRDVDYQVRIADQNIRTLAVLVST